MNKQTPAANIFELRDVTKSFGNVVAIEGVTLEVSRHETIGLVGDNGAGKSTLLKVMNGFYAPDRGEIKFQGKSLRFRSPREARSVGIETVYQDLALIPELSLWRNFFLGREIKTGRLPFQVLRANQMREITMVNLREMGLTRLRSPDEPVNILSGGERQAVAISRARYFGGSVLLLDEPTSALSVKETEKVSEAVQAARSSGLGVVVIEHNIANVHRICDRIVVMEHGRVFKSVRREDVSVSEVADMVAGRHVN
ncbi:MAG: sugar ABC transporter ATP-binding protein [Hyphomicrobiales bacterium]|nr:sugar ABC transporter ATP-binding protein [Hyphomicrobiales bacterium]